MIQTADMPHSLARRIACIRVATILVTVAAWELISRSGLLFEGVVPSTLVVAKAIGSELADPGFYRDLAFTMLASIVGFACGSVIAVAGGIGLGSNSFLRRMIEPYILALGSTPKIIFLPILFLVFGLGIESKMAKGALSAFFPVILSTTSGFIQIPPILLRVGRSMHLTGPQMIGKIYLPAMINPLLTGLRLGMAMAIIGVLSAEISYSNAGLGFRLIRDADQFKIASVYALAILIFATAALINFAFTKAQEHFASHTSRRRAEAPSRLRLWP